MAGQDKFVDEMLPRYFMGVDKVNNGRVMWGLMFYKPLPVFGYNNYKVCRLFYNYLTPDVKQI